LIRTSLSSASLEVSDPFSVFPPRAAASIDWVCFAQPPAPSGTHNLLAPSSALSLPALFHAGSALGTHPPELCSSRAAVRCFQRLSPPDVFTSSGFCSTRESTTRFSGLD
jgi:hypothetical protein